MSIINGFLNWLGVDCDKSPTTEELSEMINRYESRLRHIEYVTPRDSRGRYAKKPLWMRDPIVAEQVRGWEEKYHCKYKLKG